ncbi:MAG: surface lipoprotein assembly modifier [Pseudomonadota bacterium]
MLPYTLAKRTLQAAPPIVVLLLFLANSSLAQVAPILEERLTGLVNQGRYDQARSVLAQASSDPIERQLLEGRIAKSNGKFGTATRILEDALRARSNDIRIRRELAHTLFISGKFSRAKFHFNRLIATDPDPALRASYRSFLSEIGKKRPVTWNAFFAFEPSTNINRGSSNTTFSTSLGDLEIDDDSQSTSGIGLTYGLSATVNLDFTPRTVTQLTLGYTRTDFTEDTQFSFDRRSISFLHRFSTGKTAWNFSIFGVRERHKDSDDFVSVGTSLQASRFLNARTRVSLAASVEDRDFLESPSRSGKFNIFRFDVEYELTRSFAVSGGLSFEKSKARSESLRFEGPAIFLSATKLWPLGVATNATIFAGERQFEGLFPLTDMRRRDEYQGIVARAQFNRLPIYGFTPSVQCRAEQNNSNISLAEFDVFGCGLRFSRGF